MKNSKVNHNSQNSHEPDFLPYGRQAIDPSDIDAVISVLRGNWLTTGPTINAFEEALCDATSSTYGVACSSGTAALHLSMMAAKIGPGDSVIVPANTFLATANVVRLVGAEVIFADIDPDSGLMLTKHAEEAITRAGTNNLKAIIPVHFAGQCSHPAQLQHLAHKHKLFIIADACHALGTTYEANHAHYNIGSNEHSDMTTFSFHPVKTITTGEGGAITTENPDLAHQLRLFRNHGMTRDVEQFENDSLSQDADGSRNSWYYELSEPGLNYRISDLHCALGVSQLSRLPAIIRKRRSLAAHYSIRLAQLAPILRPLRIVEQCNAAWHLQVVCIDFRELRISRNHLMSYLSKNGVGSQVHYIPVPWQPYYRKRYGATNLPGTNAYYNSCLSLPLFESMTIANVDRVVDLLADCLGQAHK